MSDNYGRNDDLVRCAKVECGEVIADGRMNYPAYCGGCYRALESALAAERAKVGKLREAVGCLEIGACACGIPHPGERAVLQEAVNMARKFLSETADGVKEES